MTKSGGEEMCVLSALEVRFSVAGFVWSKISKHIYNFNRTYEADAIRGAVNVRLECVAGSFFGCMVCLEQRNT